MLKEKGKRTGTEVTSTGLLRCRFEANKAERKRENKHTLEGKLGRDCLLFSKAGDVYLNVDDGEIETSTLQIIVSKEMIKEVNVRRRRQSRTAM